MPVEGGVAVGVANEDVFTPTPSSVSTPKPTFLQKFLRQRGNALKSRETFVKAG